MFRFVAGARRNALEIFLAHHHGPLPPPPPRGHRPARARRRERDGARPAAAHRGRDGDPALAPSPCVPPPAVHRAPEPTERARAVRTGYPPKPLALVPELPLASLGIRAGDQLIVSSSEAAAPTSAPAPAPAPARPVPSDRAPAAASKAAPDGVEHVQTDSGVLIHRVRFRAARLRMHPADAAPRRSCLMTTRASSPPSPSSSRKTSPKPKPFGRVRSSPPLPPSHRLTSPTQPRLTRSAQTAAPSPRRSSAARASSTSRRCSSRRRGAARSSSPRSPRASARRSRASTSRPAASTRSRRPAAPRRAASSSTPASTTTPPCSRRRSMRPPSGTRRSSRPCVLPHGRALVLMDVM
jgi:hypothetical protein